jgi:large subunit ribosomal protein L5
MYDFLGRLINVALPRLRDFKGLPRSGFDGRGNYTLGLADHTIFPELDASKVEKVKGMSITIVTTAKTDEEAYELLKEMGMPFRR